MGWITQGAFAALLGVSGAAVSKAVKRGRLDGATRPSTSGAGVEIDEAEGVRLWHVNNGRPDLMPHPVLADPVAAAKPARQPRRKTTPADDDRELPGEDVTEGELPEVAISRKRTEHFKALQTELDYRLASGKSVDVDDVAQIVEREYSAVRQRMLAIKVSLAPELVGLTDEVEIQALIDQHISEALQELSDPHAAGAFGKGQVSPAAAA